MSNEIPRRARIDLMTAPELAILHAIWQVEKAGASPKLTEAIILLGKVKDCVADHVDGKKLDSIKTQQENPEGLHARYVIEKIVGYEDLGFGENKAITKKVDEAAEYFVLRLDTSGSDLNHIKACRVGVHAYANAIESHLPQLAKDLRSRYPLL